MRRQSFRAATGLGADSLGRNQERLCLVLSNVLSFPFANPIHLLSELFLLLIRKGVKSKRALLHAAKMATLTERRYRSHCSRTLKTWSSSSGVPKTVLPPPAWVLCMFPTRV